MIDTADTHFFLLYKFKASTFAADMSLVDEHVNVQKYGPSTEDLTVSVSTFLTT